MDVNSRAKSGVCLGPRWAVTLRRPALELLRLFIGGWVLAFGASCLGATTYAYDNVGRLTGVTYDNGTTITYVYDAAGNRLSSAAGPTSGVIEFYNTILNHFFLTANAIEGASIDAGGSGPGWTRTGNSFKSGGPNSVCRFYGVVAAGGPNGHFYTADPDECNQVRLDPGWHFESLDFAITPALAGGVCPAGLIPVYRAYNGRFAQHDSNHRITSNFAAYQQQIALGSIAEGIVMCAQP
jgi:YD repeat-containing protein